MVKEEASEEGGREGVVVKVAINLTRSKEMEELIMTYVIFFLKNTHLMSHYSK